jgi:hypothetical protein
MLMKYAITILFLLMTTSVLAETGSVLEQVLGQRLLEEINTNIQLRVQLTEAQAKIKTLEEAAKVKEEKK